MHGTHDEIQRRRKASAGMTGSAAYGRQTLTCPAGVVETSNICERQSTSMS